MKTWNIPSVEELEVKLTAGGDAPSWCEYERDGCIDISTHKCPESWYGAYGWTCPHQLES